MLGSMRAVVLVLNVLVVSICVAQEPGVTKPELIVEELLRGMPTGEQKEIRIMRATFRPGDRTVFHTHRFPVAVYVLEGTFTLELEGRAPKVLKAGEGFVEPQQVKMTGFNRSATDTLRVVIFYVGDPGTPFLDPVH